MADLTGRQELVARGYEVLTAGFRASGFRAPPFPRGGLAASTSGQLAFPAPLDQLAGQTELFAELLELTDSERIPGLVLDIRDQLTKVV